MQKDKKTVCIIPARGKSKRLPGKNIINFLGKPLIAHSIITARQSSLICEVFVTTDDDQIASIAKQYGAKVIERPGILSDDFATTASAIKHAIKQIEVQKLEPSLILTLQPTSPLRPINLIDKAVTLFNDFEYEIDSLITISQNRNKIGLIQNDLFIPLNYSVGQRSQDINLTYFENGLLYLTKTNIVLEKENLFGEKIKTIIIDSPFADIDIDTKEDLEWAEFIGKKYFNNYE